MCVANWKIDGGAKIAAWWFFPCPPILSASTIVSEVRWLCSNQKKAGTPLWPAAAFSAASRTPLHFWSVPTCGWCPSRLIFLFLGKISNADLIYCLFFYGTIRLPWDNKRGRILSELHLPCWLLSQEWTDPLLWCKWNFSINPETK